MLLGILALARRPRDANTKTRRQKLADAKTRGQKPINAEVECQRISSKNKRSK